MCPGLPLHYETGGTFVFFPLFLYPQCIEAFRGLTIFGGTGQILGVKNPLQRVNGNAAVCVVVLYQVCSNQGLRVQNGLMPGVP